VHTVLMSRPRDLLYGNEANLFALLAGVYSIILFQQVETIRFVWTNRCSGCWFGMIHYHTYLFQLLRRVAKCVYWGGRSTNISLVVFNVAQKHTPILS
jgi:hypothetical protein